MKLYSYKMMENNGQECIISLVAANHQEAEAKLLPLVSGRLGLIQGPMESSAGSIMWILPPQPKGTNYCPACGKPAKNVDSNNKKPSPHKVECADPNCNKTYEIKECH